MSEKCQRCGSVGEDRRTLWMACFYAMDELGLPFEQMQIHGVRCQQTGERPSPIGGGTAPVFAKPAGATNDYRFFTLLVCKRCRAEWMSAIKAWFSAAPEGEDHDADEDVPSYGSGIFIRENGAVKEITREEWDRRQATR